MVRFCSKLNRFSANTVKSSSQNKVSTNTTSQASNNMVTRKSGGISETATTSTIRKGKSKGSLFTKTTTANTTKVTTKYGSS